MSYGRNYLFGENAITKCGESPIGFAALEYGLWGIGLGGPLSIMKVPCTASKFKATSSYSVHPQILSATHMYIMTSIMLVNGYVMHINIYISNRFTHLKYCYAVTMWSHHVLSTHLKTWSCLPSPKHHLNCHSFTAFLSCSRSSLFSSSLRQWIR